MLPLALLAGVGLLYWFSRRVGSSGAGGAGGGGFVDDGAPLTPPVPGYTSAFWSGDAPTWGDTGSLVWPEFKPWPATSDVPMTTPLDLFGGLGGGGGARKLPSGHSYGTTGGGAEAPISNGERVVFAVKKSDGTIAGMLEGTYHGPSDPSEGASTVAVDRIADKLFGSELLSYGSYSIPASPKSGYHDKLERVKWYAIDPVDQKLSTFATPRQLELGVKATALVRDLHGNIVIAIVDVRKVSGDTIDVLLIKPYRVMVDEGSGPIVFPRMHEQAMVTMRRDLLVDPASIPSLAS